METIFIDLYRRVERELNIISLINKCCVSFSYSFTLVACLFVHCVLFVLFSSSYFFFEVVTKKERDVIIKAQNSKTKKMILKSIFSDKDKVERNTHTHKMNNQQYRLLERSNSKNKKITTMWLIFYYNVLFLHFILFAYTPHKHTHATTFSFSTITHEHQRDQATRKLNVAFCFSAVFFFIT